MHEDYTLLTPENVELQFDVAGVGSRIGAALIDYTIVTVGYIVLTIGGSFLASLLESPERGLHLIFSIFVAAASVILAFVAWWGYFGLFELAWNGQSPGKRVLGIRVVRQDGQPLSPTAVLVRNVLRYIDNLLGVFVMLVDPSSRRLGDMAAGTLVVRESAPVKVQALEAVALPAVADDRTRLLPNASRITASQYAIIRDYFARASSFRGEAALRLSAHIAQVVATALEVPRGEVGNPELFLATVARAYEERHRYAEASPAP